MSLFPSIFKKHTLQIPEKEDPVARDYLVQCLKDTLQNEDLMLSTMNHFSQVHQQSSSKLTKMTINQLEHVLTKRIKKDEALGYVWLLFSGLFCAWMGTSFLLLTLHSAISDIIPLVAWWASSLWVAWAVDTIRTKVRKKVIASNKELVQILIQDLEDEKLSLNKVPKKKNFFLNNK